MADPGPDRCPHCGSDLLKWLVPPGSTWSEEHFLVCFNDACSFYCEGWGWMSEHFGQVASYRYMLNPGTGRASSIPVWSAAATRERIVEGGP